ncbi:MAG TPA: DUF2846 domain-containing protein [Burkholderiales bacterium]|nr:DUF2846 domain-containing protein [Burkholderiales bacterium]
MHYPTVGALLAVAMLSACASGPKYTEVKSAIPALAPDSGRIYFYRSANMFGSGIQPSVVLNGEKVGDSVPGGFFFVDRVPGNQEVTLSTEVDKKLTFVLERNQDKYVRMSVGLGVIVYRVYPELIDPATAESEMRDLSFTGSIPKSK